MQTVLLNTGTTLVSLSHPEIKKIDQSVCMKANETEPANYQSNIIEVKPEPLDDDINEILPF